VKIISYSIKNIVLFFRGFSGEREREREREENVLLRLCEIGRRKSTTNKSTKGNDLVS